MDRRSFLKGAAAAVAIAPVAAVGAAPAIETAGLSAIDAELGSIVAGQIDLRNAFVIYQNGMCKFGPAGEPRVLIGAWAETEPPRRTPPSLPDFGEPRVIIRRTEGAEIENRFEVLG